MSHTKVASPIRKLIQRKAFFLCMILRLSFSRQTGSTGQLLLEMRGSCFGWLVGLDLMLLSCYMNLGPFFLEEYSRVRK